jgi:RNA recognition motif-containing protein
MDNGPPGHQSQGPPKAEDSFEGKLFVGGISWQTTEDGLKYYFEKYGELSDVALMRDKMSGNPRGFGFVTFKDPAGEWREM